MAQPLIVRRTTKRQRRGLLGAGRSCARRDDGWKVILNENSTIEFLNVGARAALILEQFRMSFIGCSTNRTLDHSMEALE